MRVALDLLDGYGHGLWVALPRMLALAALGLAGAWLLLSPRGDRLRRLNRPALEWTVLGLALAGGLTWVVSAASVFDDAFISFRYARHLIDGHGLVFNPGERVEGYTNFAWVMLIALGHALTDVEIPLVALVLNVACWIGNVAVVFALSRRLRTALGTGFTIPLAVVLVAVQSTLVEFGTTGMETGFCSLMVNLGLYQLVVRSAARHALAAGAFLILAALGRPDHGLMYVAGGLSLLWLRGPELWNARRRGLAALRRCGLEDLVAYSLPFVAYLAYLGWKLGYYGQILPNTYYAKSADLWWPTQGAFYVLVFLLQSHLILLLPLFVIWLKWPASDPATRRFKAFVVPAVVLFTAYVIKVGGDFMHGRFFVSLIPLVLLAVEQLVLQIYARARRPGSRPVWRWRLLAIAPLLLASAGGVELFRPREVIGGVARERTFYPLVQWSPVVVDHPGYRSGKILGKLQAAGVEPLIGARSIGMLGYYSRLPLLDLLGLTDREIARHRPDERRRPGHEKSATRDYVDKRDPILLRNWRPYLDAEHARISAVSIGSDRDWALRGYPLDLIEDIRRIAPEIEIPDMVKWMDDFIHRYSQGLPAAQVDLDRALKDIELIRGYYLEHNHDVRREAQIDAIARAADLIQRPPPQAARSSMPIGLPGGSSAGAWTAEVTDSVRAKKRSRSPARARS